MNETLKADTVFSSKQSENPIPNVRQINETKLNINPSIKKLNLTKENSKNEKNYCLICGKIFQKEKENVNKENKNEFESTFLFNNSICSRCRGPFEHKKEKLEKLSIPILVSLLLQASLKHLDVNNMVNQALYGKQSSLKSAILSNIKAPLILSPHSSQLLIINDKDSIVISSRKKDDSKNTISNMLHHKIIESNQKLFNFGALQRQAIQLTPSGRKPRTGPLGSYEDMIVQALISIGDINGSKPKDIFDWMEQHCLGIPEAFRASASQALKKAVEKEKVQRIGNGLYKINKEYKNENISKRKTNSSYQNNSELKSTSHNKNDKKTQIKSSEKNKKIVTKEKNKENINLENVSVKNESNIPSNFNSESIINKHDLTQDNTLSSILYKKRKVLNDTNKNINNNNLKSSNPNSSPLSINNTISPSFSSPMNIISNSINPSKLSDNSPPLMIDQSINNTFPDVLPSELYNNITNELNYGDQASSSSISPYTNDNSLTSTNQEAYNPSFALASNKKNELNLLSKYASNLSNGMTNIDIASLNFNNNNKEKVIYNQLMQQNPSTISPGVVEDSTGGLNILSTNLFNSTVGDENLSQENNVANSNSNVPGVNPQLFQPQDNNLSLLFDPRLQYLINPTSQTISPSVIDFLNQSNTINPLTHSLPQFHSNPSTPTRPNSLNYSIYNNMLWPNNRS